MIQGILPYNNIFSNSEYTFLYNNTKMPAFGVNPFMSQMLMPMLSMPMMPMPVIPMPPLPAFVGFFGMGFGSSTKCCAVPQGTSSSNPPSSDTYSSIKSMTLKGKGKGTAYGPAFLEKVKKISNNIGCDYRDLLAVMNSESGIDAQNRGYNGATGLIMFMPKYFNTAKIKQMSPLQQLDLVEETILKAKRQAGLTGKLSKGDLYALVFLPARANNEVLCREGERNKKGQLLNYYESNKPLDANKDGCITKEEMAHRIDKKYVSDKTFLA